MKRCVCAFAFVLTTVWAGGALAAAADVVLYASDVTPVQGNWTKASSSTGAGGQMMSSVDNGWSAASNALASPQDYFEASFTASAGTPYHVWLRLRATGDSKWNDSVWVQFNDATDSGGSAIYRTGTTNGLLVNLENCSGCGTSGWGWQDRAYWLSQTAVVQFPSTGSHTIRVQTREDGVQVDQIVLSSSTYLSGAPGSVTNDSTIIAKAAATTSSASSTSSSSSGGGRYSIPGTIQAADFMSGGEGVAYHDTTSGNTGGAYRQTDVDIEPSSEGGYDVGWIASGEWMNYNVNVTAAGNYTAQLRVASPNGGGSLHIGFNGPSNVWKVVSIPATGGWQSWTTVNVPVTLGAGAQLMTLAFDIAGFNIENVTVAGASTSSGSGSGGSGSGSGGGGGGGTGPYSGTPVALPGTIEAENFDNGGPGVSYGDTTSGNSGGAYRQTDVDIEPSSEGGYDIGWIASGEWLNYTVSVATAGSYTAQLRVASPSGGGSLHIGFNGPSGVWTSVSIPATGGWQTWSTVNVPVTLGAGTQIMTLAFDSGGFNLNYVKVVSGSSSPAPAPAPAPPPPPPSSSGQIRMMTWNIRSGLDINGNYQLPAQVQFMLAQNPDVIVLEEVSVWNEDQPTKIKNLLQQNSGQTWYTVWSPSTGCLTGGCIGEEILSRIPISDSSTTYLAPSSAGRALIYVGGVPVNVLVTHLEYYDTSLRTTQLEELMSWAPNFGGPRLVGGDFNSWWGEWWIGQMETQYTDTWLDYSGGEDGAYTTGNVRFDYIFRSMDGGWRATPSNAFVPWTDLSDHRPFVADFRIQ